jgi:cyclase
LDVKQYPGGAYRVHVNNGKEDTGLDPVDFARELEALGAGEIVVNSIDQDGAMKGYDLTLAERVRAVTNVPLTILGGAGTSADLAKIVAKFGVIGAAAGSLFVFKGSFRAVLISYPSQAERNALRGGSLT